MATRALTPVAQRRGGNVSAGEAPGRGTDWRQLILSQDAEAIWQELSRLVRSAVKEPPSGYEHITQELFLELLTDGRFDFYVKHRFSSADIRTDLLLIIGA